MFFFLPKSRTCLQSLPRRSLLLSEHGEKDSKCSSEICDAIPKLNVLFTASLEADGLAEAALIPPAVQESCIHAKSLAPFSLADSAVLQELCQPTQDAVDLSNEPAAPVTESKSKDAGVGAEMSITLMTHGNDEETFKVQERSLTQSVTRSLTWSLTQSVAQPEEDDNPPSVIKATADKGNLADRKIISVETLKYVVNGVVEGPRQGECLFPSTLASNMASLVFFDVKRELHQAGIPVSSSQMESSVFQNVGSPEIHDGNNYRNPVCSQILQCFIFLSLQFQNTKTFLHFSPLVLVIDTQPWVL